MRCPEYVTDRSIGESTESDRRSKSVQKVRCLERVHPVYLASRRILMLR